MSDVVKEDGGCEHHVPESNRNKHRYLLFNIVFTRQTDKLLILQNEVIITLLRMSLVARLFSASIG